MKQKIFIIAFGLVFFGGACSSLKDSVVDEKMRFQGSFGCPGISEEDPAKKETLAEADVSRVRCAKDEWQIHGDQITFTRTLYQFKNCENILGRIQFVSPYESGAQQLTIYRPHCKLLRLNPNWLGEASGLCMLNTLALSTPYDLHSVYHCKSYVPEFCSGDQTLTVSAEGSQSPAHGPYDQIGIGKEGGSIFMSCKRYAAD